MCHHHKQRLKSCSQKRNQKKTNKKLRTNWERSIQPNFQPVRPGKVVHLKRWKVFSTLFRLDRTNPLSFGRNFQKFWLNGLRPLNRKKWFERKKLFVFLTSNLEIPMHLTSANQNKTLVQLLFCFVSRSSNECVKVNEKGPGLSWLGLMGARGDFHPDILCSEPAQSHHVYRQN